LLVKSIQELKAANDNLTAEHDADAKAVDDLRQEFEAYKRAHP
jgi:FtsZ-binding cell division protein ZapB